MPGYSAGHELDGNCIVQSRGFDNKQFAAGISPGIAEVEDEDDPFDDGLDTELQDLIEQVATCCGFSIKKYVRSELNNSQSVTAFAFASLYSCRKLFSYVN